MRLQYFVFVLTFTTKMIMSNVDGYGYPVHIFIILYPWCIDKYGFMCLLPIGVSHLVRAFLSWTEQTQEDREWLTRLAPASCRACLLPARQLLPSQVGPSLLDSWALFGGFSTYGRCQRHVCNSLHWHLSTGQILRTLRSALISSLLSTCSKFQITWKEERNPGVCNSSSSN